jgi:hypothetical protein
LDNVVRQGGGDFTDQFDESRPRIESARQSVEVEGIDRDAMSAETWAGLEGLDAEGFGLGSLDYLPHIDCHSVMQDLQLSLQVNVHRPLQDLKDLARHRNLRGALTRDLDAHLGVQFGLDFHNGRIQPTEHLGDDRRGVAGISGSSSSGLTARKQSATRFSQPPVKIGQRISRVVPGWVVHSNATS